MVKQKWLKKSTINRILVYVCILTFSIKIKFIHVLKLN